MKTRIRSLRLEKLEDRMVLDGAGLAIVVDAPDPSSVNKVIMAGDPDGDPVDSTTIRIDANLPGSAFAGVGSLALRSKSGALYICTGTLISPIHVLTAGHCVDMDNDGDSDTGSRGRKDFRSFSDISFNLNYGSPVTEFGTTESIQAIDVHVYPDYTGFNRPSVLDDIAIIELSEAPVAADIPIYAVSNEDFVDVETITLVGYGTSGTGVDGYTVNPSFAVKRSGQNHADAILLDDEGTGAHEGFMFDFDGPTSSSNYYDTSANDLTLGNDVETMIGGGDSGGPSFLTNVDGSLTIFGINTFSGGGGYVAAPYFGSAGGGIVVSAYADWINGIIGVSNPDPNPEPDPDPTNSPPNAVDDSFKINKKTGVASGNVLSNDSDPNGDSLSVVAHAGPTSGTLVLSDNGSFTYTPVPNVAFESATFSYTVDDGKGLTDTATVTINPAKGGGGKPNNGPGANISISTMLTVMQSPLTSSLPLSTTTNEAAVDLHLAAWDGLPSVVTEVLGSPDADDQTGDTAAENRQDAPRARSRAAIIAGRADRALAAVTRRAISRSEAVDDLFGSLDDSPESDLTLPLGVEL